MPKMAALAANLKLKYSRSSAAMTSSNCLTSSRFKKLFGRMEPDGLVGQRRKRLFVVLVLEPAARAGGSEDNGKLGHGERP